MFDIHRIRFLSNLRMMSSIRTGNNMRFYSIKERHLKAFAAIGGTPKSAEILENLVLQEWATGSSRPRWCWVAEDDQAQLVARVVFTGMGDEVSYVGEYLPPDEDGVVVGAAMFEAA